MNVAVISGEVIGEIRFMFLYKNEGKLKNTSICNFSLKVNKKTIIKCYGHDNTADWIYRNIKKDDKLMIMGNIKQDGILCEKISKF